MCSKGRARLLEGREPTELWVQVLVLPSQVPLGQSYCLVGIRPGGPVGEPLGCSAAMASDVGGRKSRKQRALKAEGLWRWGGGLGLSGEESEEVLYQASVLESQCFTVFQVGSQLAL